MSLNQYSTLAEQNLFGDVVTIIEPHHDDFCLDAFATMWILAQLGALKRLKIITVMGISPGCSFAPTSVMSTFFDNIDFESIELLQPNLFYGGKSEQRKAEASQVDSLEEEFERRSGTPWSQMKEKIVQMYEGTVIAPMGLKHADHNLLARLPAKFYYREYPYWWHRSENHPKEPSLYWYPRMSSALKVSLNDMVNDFKWKTFRTVYADVQGQFNPRFGSARPYFASVNTEEFFKLDPTAPISKELPMVM